MNGLLRRYCRCLPVLALALLLAGCGAEDERMERHSGDTARLAAADTQPQALRLGALLGETSVDGYLKAETSRPFEFPADHGPHPRYRSEWWYLTLNMTDQHGADFGVQFTLFRQAVAPRAPSANPWQSNQVYLGHLALTDVGAGRHREFQRFARGHPALAGATAAPFAVWLEDWRLEGSEPGRWQLDARAEDIRLTLELEQRKAVLLQGEAGLSRKGADQASYYFSIPRFDISGTIAQGSQTHRVTGSGWYDREWSTSVLSADQIGWDWFALQFADGSEFMGFQLRRRDGIRDVHDAGVRVAPDGAVRRLAAGDFTLQPTRYWRDERGVRWPVEWRVDVGGERWRVVAALDDQRMDTAIVYWEGLVYVYDQRERRIGRGYMELTGYTDE